MNKKSAFAVFGAAVALAIGVIATNSIGGGRLSTFAGGGTNDYAINLNKSTGNITLTLGAYDDENDNYAVNISTTNVIDNKWGIDFPVENPLDNGNYCHSYSGDTIVDNHDSDLLYIESANNEYFQFCFTLVDKAEIVVANTYVNYTLDDDDDKTKPVYHQEAFENYGSDGERTWYYAYVNAASHDGYGKHLAIKEIRVAFSCPK